MRVFCLCALLSAMNASANERTLTTYDGRRVSGEVVLESERGLLIRTASGNVLVAWADIESAIAFGAGAGPSSSTLGFLGALVILRYAYLF